MSNISRRRFLASAPAVAAAVALPTAAMAVPAESPDERVSAAIAELKAALSDRYGVARMYRTANHFEFIVNAVYSGPGRYLVEISRQNRVVYWIEHEAEKDDKHMGRCFRMVPIDAQDQRRCWMFDDHLSTVLIEKI